MLNLKNARNVEINVAKEYLGCPDEIKNIEVN
jgi:hypothetical protein